MKPISTRPASRIQWGIGFMFLAGLGWTLCLILPFTPVPHRLGLAVIALAVAELSFLIGLALLGRAYYRQLKDRLRRRLQNNSKEP